MGEKSNGLRLICPGASWVEHRKGNGRCGTGNVFQNMTPGGEQQDLDVGSLFSTKDGGALLVAADGRLRKYLEKQWVSELTAWPDVMQEQQLWPVLYQDREGGLWQISRGMGIYSYHPGRHDAQQITTADGLPGDHVTCWFEDQEGSIWVGLGAGGECRGCGKKHFETIGECPVVHATAPGGVRM